MTAKMSVCNGSPPDVSLRQQTSFARPSSVTSARENLHQKGIDGLQQEGSSLSTRLLKNLQQVAWEQAHQSDIMRFHSHDRQTAAVGRLGQEAGNKVEEHRMDGRVDKLPPLSLMDSQARDD